MMNKLAQEIHENAKAKGFYEGEKNTGELLCLIHSEVSEALEADRKNSHARWEYFDRINKYTEDKLTHLGYEKKDQFNLAFERTIKNTFEDELADVVIRVLDLCAFKGIDIESHIKAKMRYNASRPHKHGKSY